MGEGGLVLLVFSGGLGFEVLGCVVLVRVKKGGREGKTEN